MDTPTTSTPDSRGSAAVPGSAFQAWFDDSDWSGAGKYAGELAHAAWRAGLRRAAEIADSAKVREDSKNTKASVQVCIRLALEREQNAAAQPTLTTASTPQQND